MNEPHAAHTAPPPLLLAGGPSSVAVDVTGAAFPIGPLAPVGPSSVAVDATGAACSVGACCAGVLSTICEFEGAPAPEQLHHRAFYPLGRTSTSPRRARQVRLSHKMSALPDTIPALAASRGALRQGREEARGRPAGAGARAARRGLASAPLHVYA